MRLVASLLSIALVMAVSMGLAACDHAGTGAVAATSVVVGGQTRTWVLHLPRGGGRGRPLVLVLHGGGGTAAGMERITHFDDVADRYDLVVAYPQGWRGRWNDGRPGSVGTGDGSDDIGFLRALVAALRENPGIDLHRVYVTGLSNGGFMSSGLACEASDLIAAAAPVAATMAPEQLSSCHPSHAISVLYTEGTSDPLVPYSGGNVQFLGVAEGQAASSDANLNRWRTLDNCEGTGQTMDLPDVDAGDSSNVQVTSFAACRSDSEVVRYTISGGGHTWPGGEQYLPVRTIGATNRDIDLSARLWTDFFAHQSLR